MGIQGVRAPRGSPIFLDQTESRRAEKNLFRDRPPYLSVGRVGMIAPPPPYLTVWKRHWCWLMLRTNTTIRTWSITSHLNRTSLVTKGFTLWHNRDLFLPGPTQEIPFAYSGSQSELRISLILSAQSRIRPYNNRQMYPFVACEPQTFLLAHRRWGTFREEVRLRLSDRNSILMT